VTSKLDRTLHSSGREVRSPHCLCDGRGSSLQDTEQLVVELGQVGADIIELGVRFRSIADGPVIQQAAERALRSGTSLRTILPMVTRLRARTQIPLV